MRQVETGRSFHLQIEKGGEIDTKNFPFIIYAGTSVEVQLSAMIIILRELHELEKVKAITVNSRQRQLTRLVPEIDEFSNVLALVCLLSF